LYAANAVSRDEPDNLEAIKTLLDAGTGTDPVSARTPDLRSEAVPFVGIQKHGRMLFRQVTRTS